MHAVIAAAVGEAVAANFEIAASVDLPAPAASNGGGNGAGNGAGNAGSVGVSSATYTRDGSVVMLLGGTGSSGADGKHDFAGETRDAAGIEDMPIELLYDVFGCQDLCPPPLAPPKHRPSPPTTSTPNTRPPPSPDCHLLTYFHLSIHSSGVMLHRHLAGGPCALNATATCPLPPPLPPPRSPALPAL